jgi:hypothetical protein
MATQRINARFTPRRRIDRRTLWEIKACRTPPPIRTGPIRDQPLHTGPLPMACSFRDSVNVGPLRVNLSTSGVGYRITLAPPEFNETRDTPSVDRPPTTRARPLHYRQHNPLSNNALTRK